MTPKIAPSTTRTIGWIFVFKRIKKDTAIIITLGRLKTISINVTFIVLSTAFWTFEKIIPFFIPNFIAA